MSNKIYVNYMKVLALEDDGTVRAQSFSSRDSESFAWTVWDDCETHFDYGFETIEELKKTLRPENVIAFLKGLGEYESLSDYALDYGLYFNGTWYDGKELKKIQEPEEDDGG